MKSPYGDMRLCEKLDKQSVDNTFNAPGGEPRDAPSPSAQAAWDEAKETCLNCPVYLTCRQEHWGQDYGVWGGTDQHERYLYRRQLTRRLAAMKPAERAAVAATLYARRMAGSGQTARVIARATGYAEQTVKVLLEEHVATLSRPARERRVPGRLTAAEREQLASMLAKGSPMRFIARVMGRSDGVLTAAIAALQLPAPPEPRWPSASPEGDAWVWHQYMARNANYKGQTEDGMWMLMTLRGANKSPTRSWFPAELVQFRKKITPQILERGKKEDAP